MENPLNVSNFRFRKIRIGTQRGSVPACGARCVGAVGSIVSSLSTELPPVDFQHFEAAFARFRGAREVRKRSAEREALETYERNVDLK
eukprot:s1976_g3.t1